MSANLWELYEDHPDFAQAEQAIEIAWAEARCIAPDQPSKERARLAEKHVWRVLERWADVGAMDSEPRDELAFRVRKHFGIAGGYL